MKSSDTQTENVASAAEPVQSSDTQTENVASAAEPVSKESESRNIASDKTTDDTGFMAAGAAFAAAKAAPIILPILKVAGYVAAGALVVGAAALAVAGIGIAVYGAAMAVTAAIGSIELSVAGVCTAGATIRGIWNKWFSK